MKIVLDDYQKEVLAHKGDFLLCTGRRVGKTYIMARKAVDLMLSRKNTKILMFSLTEEQAMLIMVMAKNYLMETAPKTLVKKQTQTNKKTLTLKNGSVMKVRPAGDTGDSGRGFEADVTIVDEASRMGKYFWIAVLPIVLMTAGEVWMGSTPFGKQGYFWERFNESYNLKDPDARFKVFYTTTEKVIEERKGWTPEHKERVKAILAADKKTMSKLEFGQEYQGLFMEDIMKAFDEKDIRKAMQLQPKGAEKDKNYFLGVDVARYGKDEGTYETIEEINGKLFHRDNQITTKQSIPETFRFIKQLDTNYDFYKIFTDGEGGIGIGVTDMLLDEDQTKRKTIPILNSTIIEDRWGDKTKVMKNWLYQNLIRLIQNGDLLLLDDESVFHSLNGIQYEYIEDTNGKPIMRYFGKKGAGGDHIAEGLTRAALAWKYKDLNPTVYTIKV
jgi:hypothetical protein